jgi:hypothetical protein
MFCLKCNSEHDGSYGSGKYCCRPCANSRVRSDETKRKIANSVKEGIASGSIKQTSTKGKKLKPRTAEHSAKISEARIAYWDKVGRKTKDESAKLNVLNVQNYRARKYNATPDYVDSQLIRKIYESCPTGYEVDHIVPLACGGLHHPDNFQYLPALENRRKNKTQNYDKSLVIRWQDVVK